MKLKFLIAAATAMVLCLALTLSACDTSINDPEGEESDTNAETTSAETTLSENELLAHLAGKDAILTAGEFPMDYLDDPEPLKRGASVFVSNENGLTLTGKPYDHLQGETVTDVNAYRFEDFFGTDEGVYFQGEKIIDEPCVGMVTSFGYDSLAILTSGEDGTKLYGTDRNEDGSWKELKSTVLSEGKSKFMYYSFPSMFYGPTEDLYVITENEFLVVDLRPYFCGQDASFEEIGVTSVDVPEYWNYIHPTSAVKIDGSLYFGEHYGVVRYEFDTNKFSYYKILIYSNEGI